MISIEGALEVEMKVLGVKSTACFCVVLMAMVGCSLNENVEDHVVIEESVGAEESIEVKDNLNESEAKS